MKTIIISLLILFSSVSKVEGSHYEMRASELHFYKHSLGNDYLYASPLDIIKTQNGELWLFFESFILRKQGPRITRYDLPTNAHQYGSSKINSIVYKNRLIFAYKGLLFTHDKASDKLVEWKQLSSKSDTITDLLVSSDGKLWVSSLNSVQFLQDIESDFIKIERLNNSLSNSLFEDNDGNIWVGTFLASLFKIYNHINPSDSAIVEMHKLSSSAPIQINDIKQIDNGELLLATSLGMFKFVLKTKTVSKMNTPLAITSVKKLILGKSNLWIHANDQIFVQDKQSKTYYPVDLVMDMQQETSEPKVKSMYIDEEQVVWASLHNAGLYSYSKFRNKFAKVTITPETNLGKSISVFHPLNNNQFVIGNGINTYISTVEMPLEFNITAYNHRKNTSISFASGKELYFVEQDSIRKMSLPSRVFKGKNTKVVNQDILWLTTELEGLHRYKLLENSLQEFAIEKIDTSNVLYVTQLVNGDVVLFYPFSITIYRNNGGPLELIENLALKHEIIKIEEKAGFVFSHLSDRSISRLNLATRHISNHQFDIANIGCVVNNGENIWWLAEIGGDAYRIDQTLESIKQFGQFDGIPAGGLSGEVCHWFDNQIVFSSYSGLVRTTSTIHDKNLPPPQVNLESTFSSPNRGRLNLESAIYEIKQHEFPLSFFIFQSSLASPSKNSLRYRLIPVNKQWSTLESDKSVVNYQNLPTGKYSLEYFAINNDGIESEKKILPFSVLPPIWLTWWAKLFYGLSVVAFVWLLFRIRLHSIKAKAAVLEIAVAERTEEVSKKKLIVDNLLREKQFEISNVSHEFRTPLTLILGPINQLLKREDLCINSEDKSVRDKLQVVKNNASRLLRMVEQLLQLESFKLNRYSGVEKQNSRAIINFVFDSFQHFANDKGVLLIKGELLDADLYFVPDGLEKIMINLISNAIKYTPAGGTIKIKSSPNGENHIQIEVCDDGIGIAEEMKDKVFERFQRATSEEIRQIRGSGIGLSLVKELVDSHEGSIQLLSELNVGTTVIITLPIDQNRRSNADAQYKPMFDESLIKEEIERLTLSSKTLPASNADNKQHENLVLIVEDNPEMQNYIIEGLAGSYTCLTAANGNEGLALAEKYIPDLIVSDVMMPKMNGFELTEKLKTEEKTNHIPVILLTALSDQNNRLEGLSRKADDYLTKPFDTEELLIKIENLIEIRSIMKAKFMNDLFRGKENSSGKVDYTEPTEQQAHQFMQNLDSIISETYMNPNTKISDIATRMFMSQRQLLRKLKGVVNISPAEYLRRYRLERAKELIISGAAPSSVAIEVGFSSHTHFGKCFKAQYGCAPSSYK